MENTRITISLNIWEDDDPTTAPSFINTITYRIGGTTFKRPLASLGEDLDIYNIIREAHELKTFINKKH